MGNRRKAFRVLALAVLLLVEPLQGTGTQGQTAKESGDIPIRIAVQPALPQASAWIAYKLGYFKDESLRVDGWEVFTTGPPMTEALAAGKVDVSFLGTMPFLTAMARLPVKVIVTGGAGGARHSVVVLNDSPYEKFGDLISKNPSRKPRIGTKKGSSADAVFPFLTQKYGVDPAAFELVDLDPPGAVTALQLRQVVATFYWEPFNAIPVVDKKIGRRIADAAGFEDSSGPVVAAAWIERYGERAGLAFARSIIRAQHLIVTQPAEAARILHEAQPKLSVPVLTDSMLRIYWTYRIEPWQMETWRQIEEWMLNAKKIGAPIPWERVIDSHYYKKAEGEMRAIVAELEANNFSQSGSFYKSWTPRGK